MTALKNARNRLGSWSTRSSMNDRERAHLEFLRRLLRLDHGKLRETVPEVMRPLAVAVTADVIYLAGMDGFEHGCSESSHDVDRVRARVPELLERIKQRAFIDDAHNSVTLPVGGTMLRGLVYAHTKSVFVEADLALIQLFTERLEPFAGELALQSPRNLRDEIRDFQYRRVRQAIARNGGNMSSAARDLGVARSVLYRLCREAEERDRNNKVSQIETISSINRPPS